MEASQNPEYNDDNLIKLPNDEVFLELLKVILGEDGHTYLNLDKAISTVEQAQPVWQAPFVIGLSALTLLYDYKEDSSGKLSVQYRFPAYINSRNKKKSTLIGINGLCFVIPNLFKKWG